MLHGYNGKILHVDLTLGKMHVEEPSWVFYRTYWGGGLLALYYLLREVPVGADALGPENVLVLAPSVITGAPYPGLSRFTVAAKSPLTGAFGEAQAGGWWGPELKFAGYDAVVVRGRSPKPVYLWIHNGEAEILEAGDLWGMFTADALDAIRAKHGDRLIRVAGIGPAGERLVRLASVIDDGHHSAARTGMGAVMGSKNLKAIACRGTMKPEYADPERIKEMAKNFARLVSQNADTSQLHRYGTSQYFINANRGGALPTRNWTAAQFEGAEKVSHVPMDEELRVRQGMCYACSVTCKPILESDSPLKIDRRYGGPEFESMTSFSSIEGSDDLHVMAKATEMSNAYGIDSIGVGAAIAWTMECFERGLLTEEDTGGISYRFGDPQVILKTVEMIGKREGWGEVLGNGTTYAARLMGRGTEQLDMSVKGQAFAMHEPRSKFGLGYHFALSPTGADHIQAEHDGAFDPGLVGYTHKADRPSFFMEQTYPLGILEPVRSLSEGADKVRLFCYLNFHFSFMDTLDICVFTTAPVRITTFSDIPQLVEAITGWNTSLWEIMKVGERRMTLARAFNVKHGFSAKDDMLPDRMFEPQTSGPQKGIAIDRAKFSEGLRLYYEMMGWDRETGVPTAGKLEELNLGWVRPEIGR